MYQQQPRQEQEQATSGLGVDVMADLQRKTAQLYDKSDTTTQYNAYLNANGTWVLDNSSRTVKLRCKGNTTYTISIAESSTIFRISEYSDYDLQAGGSTILHEIIRGTNLSEYTFTTAADSECLVFQASYALYDSWLNSLMFVEGSTAKPYEPYGWVSSIRIYDGTNWQNATVHEF